MSVSIGRVRQPERLQAHHDLSSFHNGKHSSLDEWLKSRALKSEGLSARTYVICADDTPNRVLGYCAISTAMAQRIALPNAKLRRGMPEQVPLLLVGRLAIDDTCRGRGLGTDLLRDALQRCIAAADIVGARGAIAHAIDDDAVGFYQRHGFVVSPFDKLVMLMPMETARAILE